MHDAFLTRDHDWRHLAEGITILLHDRALAQRLGARAVVLMRGHGVTVAAPDLRQAVFRAVYVDVNAKLQLQAIGLGTVNYLTDAEGRAAAAANATQIGRAWDMWKMRVEGKL